MNFFAFFPPVFQMERQQGDTLKRKAQAPGLLVAIWEEEAGHFTRGERKGKEEREHFTKHVVTGRKE